MRKDVVLDAFASSMYVQTPESLKTEVADLRTGEDGTVYASAGEAVRGQIHKIQNNVLDLKSDLYESESYAIEEQLYTEQLSISLDTPTSTASVFNGKGYAGGYTLNSSGVAISASGSIVSGYISFKIGDVLRIRHNDRTSFDTSTMIALYAEGETSHSGTGKTVANMAGNAAYGGLTISGNELVWDSSSISYYTWTHTDVAYLRMSTVSSDVIITVNEEITSETRTVINFMNVLNPEIKINKDNLNFEVPENKMQGKTVCCIGDSLFGLFHDDTSTPAFVAKATGATVYNCGFGGCRMATHPTPGYAAFSMHKLASAIATGSWEEQDAQASKGESYFTQHLKTLKAIDFSKLNCIVIHYGTNDFNSGVAFENASNQKDVATICGAFRFSIETLLAAYPNIHLFVSLPIYRMWDGVGAESYKNSNNQTLVQCAQAIADVAESYNIPVIDSYHNLGMNRFNFANFSSDKTHLTTEAGRERFGRLIAANIF